MNNWIVVALLALFIALVVVCNMGGKCKCGLRGPHIGSKASGCE